jgi:hypothetical protein
MITTRNAREILFHNHIIHVNRLCFLFLILLFDSLTCFAQHVERKIIIDKGNCYYATIDPEFQIATLYVVDFHKPVKSAKKLILPAGRNFNVPVIPFSWDLAGNDVIAINFMNNARSNRKQAVKRIPIHSLNEWDEKTAISEVILSSAEYPSYTSFEPYIYITGKSTILDHFFFDGIALSDSSFFF